MEQFKPELTSGLFMGGGTRALYKSRRPWWHVRIFNFKRIIFSMVKIYELGSFKYYRNYAENAFNFSAYNEQN